MRDINYCCSYSFYAATLYIAPGPIFTGLHAIARICKRAHSKAKFGSRVIWNLLAERCLKSYCSIVSLFVRHLDELLPQVYREPWTLLLNVARLLWACFIDVDVVAQPRTTSLGVFHRRGHCWSTSNDFTERVTSSWTLLIDADHQLDDLWEFREASTEAAGSWRLVWTQLLDANTPTQQFIALSVVVRRGSQILPTHAGSTWFVVNVRLTARLQSLPLARCWPVCFALF